MGVSVEYLRRRRDEIATSDLTSLNTLVAGEDDSSIERLDTIASDDESLDPEAAAGRSAATASPTSSGGPTSATASPPV